ncbi:MAG: hypothetical protein GY861_04070 [bacterium]|nr:hypothetical protein [bacterium]
MGKSPHLEIKYKPGISAWLEINRVEFIACIKQLNNGNGTESLWLKYRALSEALARKVYFNASNDPNLYEDLDIQMLDLISIFSSKEKNKQNPQEIELLMIDSIATILANNKRTWNEKYNLTSLEIINPAQMLIDDPRDNNDDNIPPVDRDSDRSQLETDRILIHLKKDCILLFRGKKMKKMVGLLFDNPKLWHKHDKLAELLDSSTSTVKVLKSRLKSKIKKCFRLERRNGRFILVEI